MADDCTVAGIQLKYGDPGAQGDGGLAAFGNIDSVADMPGIDDVEKYEKHRLDQVTDPTELSQWFKKYGFSWVEPGTLEFVVGFNKTKLAAGYSLVRVEKGWRIIFADGSTLDFDGALTRFRKTGSDKSGEVKVNCRIQVSGGVVFTAAED